MAHVESIEEEYKRYLKTFKKYGCRVNDMQMMQDAIEDGSYRIVLTTKRYHSDGKWIEDSSKQQDVDIEFYLNCITSIPLFNDRVEYTNTRYGRIPCKLSCVSWGTGTEKVVRLFDFVTV